MISCDQYKFIYTRLGILSLLLHIPMLVNLPLACGQDKGKSTREPSVCLGARAKRSGEGQPIVDPRKLAISSKTWDFILK